MENNLMKNIFAKAKANPKKVAFPEANNPKMLEAMEKVTKEGYAQALVVGNIDEVKKLVKENKIDDSNFKYVDNLDETYSNDVLQRYLKLPNIIYGEKSLTRRMKDPLYFALMMEAVGDVDVTFAGINSSTGEVIYAAQTIIGLEDNLDTISSIGIAEMPNYTFENGTNRCYTYYRSGNMSYQSFAEDCEFFEQEIVKKLNLHKLDYDTDLKDKYALQSVVLASGGKSINSNCNYDGMKIGSNPYFSNDGTIFMFYRMWILLDVNGERGPNRWGYDVFFNTKTGFSESIGCKSCFLNLQELFKLSEMAKAVIGVRCGLMEYIAESGTPAYVIYKSFKNRLPEEFMSAQKAYEGFSLAKLPENNYKMKEYIVKDLDDYKIITGNITEDICKIQN